MEEIEPGAPGGLNRRSLIKRAGIVGAGVAAWSTPMVTSLASKALRRRVAGGRLSQLWPAERHVHWPGAVWRRVLLLGEGGRQWVRVRGADLL